MTLQQFQDILYNIKYKPGFFIRAYEDYENLGIRVVVRLECVNAYDFSSKIPITTAAIISYEFLNKIRNERAVLEFVLNTIRNLEEHEVREFFKYKDKNYIDPHPTRK